MSKFISERSFAELLAYINQGINKGLLERTDAEKALEMLGISFEDIQYDPDTLEFVRNVSFKFD